MAQINKNSSDINNASKVTVKLSQKDNLEIKRIFPDLSIDEVANNIAQLAFKEWLGWLSGYSRYTSLRKLHSK